MSKQVTSTHIRMLAKGYWEQYFNWRLYPKSKGVFLISAVLVGVVIALAVLAPGVPTVDVATGDTIAPMYSRVLDAAVLVLGLLALVLFFVGMAWYFRAKEDFLSSTVDRWEQEDDALPSVGTVVAYLTGKNVVE